MCMRWVVMCVLLQSMTSGVVNAQGCIADIVVLVDHSASIGNNGNPNATVINWSMEQDFLKRFIDAANIAPDQSHMAVVGFADEASVYFDFSGTQTPDSLKDMVDNIMRTENVGGKTNHAAGIYKTRTEVLVESNGYRFIDTFVLMITDGHATKNVENFIPEATKLKTLWNAEVAVVGVTSHVDDTFLRENIVSSDEHYFGVLDYNALAMDTIVEAVLEKICDTPITPSPTTTTTTPTTTTMIPTTTTTTPTTTITTPTTTTTTSTTTTTTPTTTTPTTTTITPTTTPTTTTTTPTTTTTTPTTTTTTPTTTTTTPTTPTTTSTTTTTTPTTPTTTTTTPTTTTTTPTTTTTTPTTTPTTTTTTQTTTTTRQTTTSMTTPSSTPDQNLGEECDNPVDLIIVLDASGSVGEENFQSLREFVGRMVSELDIGGDVRVGLITYSHTVIHHFALNTYNTQNGIINYALDEDKLIYTRGQSATQEAIRYLRNTGFTPGNGDREGIPNVALIITDGRSTNLTDALEEAYNAKKEGIHLLIAAIGSQIDQYELYRLSSYPYSVNVRRISNYLTLHNALGALLDLICDNLNECENNPCSNGGTCVDGVGVYYCRCPSGRGGVNCEKTCRNPSDLLIALDASGSIGNQNFLLESDFTREIINGINFEAGVRLGVLTYSNYSDIRFYLNDYTTTRDAQDGMTLQYSGGKTNTSGAIKVMNEIMFTSSRGDRSSFPNRALIITDGRSDNPEATWQQARISRDNDVETMVVALGDNVREWELEAMATYPSGENVLRVERFGELASVLPNVLDAICDNGDSCSPNQCQNNAVCEDGMNHFLCNCQSGFSGNLCDRGCQEQLELVYIIDSSGSIQQERFPRILDMLKEVTKQFRVGANYARIGAVVFSDNARIEFRLDDYNTKQDVLTALTNIRFMHGSTNMANALQLAEAVFADSRRDATKVAVLVTDGASTINQEQTTDIAVGMRENDITILSVAIGRILNMLELRGVTSHPTDTNIFMSPSYNDLPGLVPQIVAATCNDENECSTNPCRNGGQCFDRLSHYTCDCRASGDYTGENCDRRCTRQMDVVFLLDFSGSVDVIHEMIISVTKQIVYGIPVYKQSRVGVMWYSDITHIHFYLDQYQSTEEIINALSFSQSGGTTNTAEALRVMTRDMFTFSGGDQSGVPNKAMLITDGLSTVNRDETVAEANNAKANDIEIYVGAVGFDPFMSEINQIASSSNNIFYLQDKNAVTDAANTVLDHLCDS